MTDIALASVVLDESIYPRADWSRPTVSAYAEALAAGEVFPPIVLEAGTNRLLDGMHRMRAHRLAERETIAADFHEIPEGVPAKLYAASLSTRHGDRIQTEDMRQIAREIASANPDFSVVIIAKHLGVTRQTVGKYIGDITERRDAVQACRVDLLSRAGWKQKDIANHLKLSQPTVSRIQNVAADKVNTTEDLLREAAADLPIDAEPIVEQIREERIFATWSDDERGLLKRLRDSETIVVSLRSHANLIAWATDAGLYERVDRKSAWGNPFVLPDDGDRATVISNYEKHYLPYKPKLLDQVGNLKGKALGCWCAPEACHADVLKAAAER